MIEIVSSPVKVYARVDATGGIIEVASDVFLKDPAGWIQIDEGYGDRYAHAQGNYFLGSMKTEEGVPRFRWDGKRVLDRAAGDIAGDIAAIKSKAMENAASANAAAQEDVNARVQKAIAGLGLAGVAEELAKIKAALAKLGIKL